MAKNKLGNLNNHLFAALERLNDESLTNEQAAIETQRAKAIALVSKQIILNSKVMLDAMKMVANGEIGTNDLPESFVERKMIDKCAP